MSGCNLCSAKPRSAQHHSMKRRERCIQHGSVSFDPDVDAYVACFQYTMLANVISSGDGEMTCLAKLCDGSFGVNPNPWFELRNLPLESAAEDDCPVAERLIRRTRPAKKLLGDKAYNSAELRHTVRLR